MKQVVIDGRCIQRGRLDGTQRYAQEILIELDKIVPPGQYEILLKSDSIDLINLKNIHKIRIDCSNTFLWRIRALLYLVKQSAWYINFANGPAIWRNSIITQHDIYAFYNVYNNTNLYCFKRKCIALINAVVAKHIVTVSKYSKSTILEKLPVKSNKISVIYNGWQHLKDTPSDFSILKRENLQPGDYYFFIGRLVHNKNIKWIFNIADHNPEDKFVISGAIRNEKFNIYYGKNNNIIYTGFVSDAEMSALFQSCKAFLFPSLMEGFGIPPLEALYYNVPIIISDTSSLPEIYEDCAHYIDPFKYDYCLDEILREKVEEPDKILSKFSWEKSARQWYELIKYFTG